MVTFLLSVCAALMLAVGAYKWTQEGSCLACRTSHGAPSHPASFCGPIGPRGKHARVRTRPVPQTWKLPNTSFTARASEAVKQPDVNVMEEQCR